MDKFCEDCVHNAVCQYGAYCPSGHCNDKDTLDDLRPQGEWIEKQETPASVSYYCSNCKMRDLPFLPYCPWCGAKMKGGEENE